MLGSEHWLLDHNLSVLSGLLWVPLCFNQIERSIVQPQLSPLLQGELWKGEILLHFSEEILDRSIIPFVFVEILRECLAEVLLFHQVQQLLHGGCSFRVSDSVEDWISHARVSNFTSNWVSSDHLVLMVSPTFSLKEGGHGWFVVNSLAVVLYLFEAKVRNEIREALIQP